MGDFVPHESQEEPSSHIGGDAAVWEMGFYEDILKRNPDYVEVLMLLGNLYTGRKMYGDGLKVDQRLATLRQDDPIVHYNLACSYSLVEQADDAFGALSRAMELGYADVEHVEKDGDLENVRSDARYQEILARMRRAEANPERRSKA